MEFQELGLQYTSQQMGNLQKELAALPYAASKWNQTDSPHVLVAVQSGVKARLFRTAILSHENVRLSLFRSIYKQFIVEIFAILSQTEASHLIANHRPDNDLSSINVIVEHIEYRLSDLGVLSLQDGAYILSQGVKASKTLATIFDNFLFDLESIGINERGKCKFWINSNFYNDVVENRIIQSTGQKPDSDIIFSADYQYCFSLMGNLCNGSEEKPRNKIKSYSNLIVTLTNLIDLIEAQMLLGLATQERVSYSHLKKRYLNNSNNSRPGSGEHKLKQLQEFVMALARLANVGSTYSISLPDNRPSRISYHQLGHLPTEVSEYDFSVDPQIIKKNKIQKHIKQATSKRSLSVQNNKKISNLKFIKVQSDSQLQPSENIRSKVNIAKIKQSFNLSSSINGNHGHEQKRQQQINIHLRKMNKIRRKASQPELYCNQRCSIQETANPESPSSARNNLVSDQPSTKKADALNKMSLYRVKEKSATRLQNKFGMQK